MYQAEELSAFEKSFVNGNSKRETEKQGWLSPSPPSPYMEVSAGQAFTSQPPPNFNMDGSWYPYSYNFIPTSILQEQLVRPAAVMSRGETTDKTSTMRKATLPITPVLHGRSRPSLVTFQLPRAPKTPAKNPVMAGYGQGGAQTGLCTSSHGGFSQFDPEAGGNNMGRGM